MAISNKFGPMVLTTGNKSEMSVGYATLYGDMCGGYQCAQGYLQDRGFRAWRAGATPTRPRARWGRDGAVIPDNASSASRRPPSCAPTRPIRITLPPYEILDGILECLVEREMSFEDTVAKGL